MQRCKAALDTGTDLRTAAGDDFERWVSDTKILTTDVYVESTVHEPRYHRKSNLTLPPKIGRHLKLFDCLTCDICVPVCPNDANFTFKMEESGIPIRKVTQTEDGWVWREEGVLTLDERHQIASFADFCNDCGNCDVFCPEDGGPYVIKPRFFRRREDWSAATDLDGFQLEKSGDSQIVHGRFDGEEFVLQTRGEVMWFGGEGFSVQLCRDQPEGTVDGDGAKEIDLTYCYIMDALRKSIFDTDQINYINSLEQSDKQVL